MAAISTAETHPFRCCIYFDGAFLTRQWNFGRELFILTPRVPHRCFNGSGVEGTGGRE
jgi:hypothetical protein